MSDTPDEQQDEIRYPTNHVVAVLDTEQQLGDAVAALESSGFLPTELNAVCGVDAADRLKANTGRSGLGGLAMRIADRLGIENTEMEFKDHYEQALRDGRYVLLVAAPTDERKDHAAKILRDHGANAVSFMGRFSIEGIVPPTAPPTAPPS